MVEINFFNECRSLPNITLISNKGSKRKMLKTFIDNEILLIASDQNAKKHGTNIDFLVNHFNTKRSWTFLFCN